MTPSALASALLKQPSEREAAVEDADRLSYGALRDHVAGLARALAAQGVGAGDRVAFCGRPGLDFLVAWLGILSADATYVGINPAYRAREVQTLVEDAEPRLVLASETLDEASLTELRHGAARASSPPPIARFSWRSPDAIAAASPASPSAHATPGIALIVYTSGTTGTPKGALLTADNLHAAASIYVARYGAVRLLHNLPINHVGGLVDIAAPTLLGGGTLVFMGRFEPDRIPAVIEQERITLWGQVPAMFDLALAHGAPERHDLSSLRQIAWSGAPLSAPVFDRLATLGAQLNNSYGLTESTGSVTFTTPGDSKAALLETVGRPLESGDFRIAGHDGPVAAGQPGEIQLKGPLVFAGYHRRPEATADAFTADGWFRTGDLATQDPDGAVRLIGRLNEMFKSGGYNVYPREIELVLERYPGVALAAVVPEPDPVWQEVGHAYLIVREALDLDALRDFCRAELANYKIPKRFTAAADLPLLPIGKIDKQALKATRGDNQPG